MSWIAAMPEEQRAEILVRIHDVVHGGKTPPELPLHVVIGLTALA